MTVVMIPGKTSGSMTLRITVNSLAPSSSADSRRDIGTVENALRIMKMPNGSWKVA